MLDWLKGWLNDFLGWLLELLQWIPKKVFSVAMDGIAKFFEAIPVPGFVTDAQGYFNQIAGQIIYFGDMFQLSFGFKVMFAALLARFILRRIPIIG